MAPIPKRTAGRIAAAVWLLAWFGVLAIAIMGRAERDTEIVVIYLMLALSFPSGVAVSPVIAGIFWVISFLTNYDVPGGFPSSVIAWVVLGVLGYAQWFIAVPWVYRKVRCHLTTRWSGP